MDIISNILDREIDQTSILNDMFDNYEKSRNSGNYYIPQIARSISSQLHIPLGDISIIVERYVYRQLILKLRIGKKQ